MPNTLASALSRLGLSAHLGRSGSLRRDRDYRYFKKPAGIVTASSTLTPREAAYEEPISGGGRVMETLMLFEYVTSATVIPRSIAACRST